MIRLAMQDPTLLSAERREAQGDARPHLVRDLVAQTHAAPTDRVAQHHLLFGAAGAGKTWTLARIADVTDAIYCDLRAGVHGLTGLWNAILVRAGIAPASDASAAMTALVDLATERGGRITALLDSFDRALETLDGDLWALRDILSTMPQLTVIGTARALPSAVIDYDAAFFDFFALHSLDALGVEDSTSLLHTIARNVDNNIAAAFADHADHTAAIARLCSGNPRALALTVEALQVHGDSIGVFECLDHICDRLTPQFDLTLAAISPQARVVLAALAAHWHPAHAKTIGTRLGMPTNKVSTYLDRLSRDGIVDKVPMPPGKTMGFQLRDRLANLWFLLRGGRASRALVHALTRLALGETDAAAAFADVHATPREHLAIELRDLLPLGTR